MDGAAERGFAWGPGWGLWQDEDERFIWHWGDNPGFKAFVIASLHRRMPARVVGPASVFAGPVVPSPSKPPPPSARLLSANVR